MADHSDRLQPFRILGVEDDSDEVPVDFEPEPDEAPIPLSSPFQRQVVEALQALAKDVRTVKKGQTDLTVAFGALVPRVAKLETEAVWGRRLVVVLKAAAPFVGGIIVARFPQLASLVGDALKAVSGLQ